MSSLDKFLTGGADEGSGDQKKKFELWLSKILSDPSSISVMIENALKRGMFTEWEEESNNHKFRIGSYYPSAIEHCLRQQAYSYLHPEPPTHEELAIFNEGRAIHELVALALRRSGLISVEGSEVVVDLKFTDDAKLHGRIDDLLLIRLDEAGESFRLYVPLEIKSTSSLPEEPRQSHYYQLSTYLLAQNYPLGILLYWVKREGVVKAFTIVKEDAMLSVLRERVLELHASMKGGVLPRKEAVQLRDYAQCERCSYIKECNPFLIDGISRGSHIALMDVDSALLDTSQRRRSAMQSLGLPPSSRLTDIVDEETKTKYWDLLNEPGRVGLDVPTEKGREIIEEQKSLGRIPVGISSGRRDSLLEVTRSRLANLGILVPHLIFREPGNYDTDGKFKTKWAMRLAKNYEIDAVFDKDAVTSSIIKKSVEEYKKSTVERSQD
ncbi:MAG: PD-(D/E)XK nuclease family protein [Nitrososphaerota archaeon]|nr:PD-(D/E)XK nuclease family protein [Nitrososphaerota archaeon]